MTKIMVRVEGQSELLKGLKDIRVHLPDNAAKETGEVLDKMVDTAKALVKVDTGSLQKSIRRESYARPAGCFLQMGFRAGGYIVNPKTKRIVDYARHQEWGTWKMLPRPFMFPAAHRHEPELMRRLKRVGMYPYLFHW